MSIYFISDLHLSQHSPKMLNQFVLFTEYLMHNADHLYILGDFFDAWLGDDLNNHLTQTVISQLTLLKKSGVNISIMHGNRDFLLGKQFCQQAHVNLISDPSMIHPFGISTLLLHGDTLCTQDINYQKFRKIIRNKFVQLCLLRLPLSFRKKLAAKARIKSNMNKKKLNAKIMDASTDAIKNCFAISHAKIMIHGHTHRLNTHQHNINKQIHTRIVLGDWHENEGNTLYITKDKWQLIRFIFNDNKDFVIKSTQEIPIMNCFANARNDT